MAHADPDRQTVCLIEDDSEFALRLMADLQSRNLVVQLFRGAEEFVASGRVHAFDHYIIDLGLPGIDGAELIAMIRSQSNAGILVVSGRIGPDAFVGAFAAGADMVLNKPVRFEQIVHGIEAIARRMQAAGRSPAQIGKWRITDGGRTLVSPGGLNIALTYVEARLLLHIAAMDGAAIARASLIAAAGMSGDEAKRSLDAVIFRLRRKIEAQAKCPAPLRALHGFGYQAAEPITVDADLSLERQ
ncbi:MAG: hypothetical protein RIQ99_403 [Pseudomonadota bacterium]|jgi:DNA-binding response OmpR family regulator